MQGIREERDSDRTEAFSRQSDVKTQTNRHQVVCGACARVLFVDDETFANVSRALEIDPTNQFICDECVEDQQDQAFAAR